MSNAHFILFLRWLWVGVIAWYEYGIFFVIPLSSCQWPDPPLAVIAGDISHILIVADPQILDHRSYPTRSPLLTRLSQLVVDLNLRKSWRAALGTKPDVVIFLGDMMDSGRYDMSDAEYEQYFQRFKSIFSRSNVPSYFLPGNHDINLHQSQSFSAQARQRYVAHFGDLNQQVELAGHHLVMIDAPSLVLEDKARTDAGISYSDMVPVEGGTIEFVKSLAAEERRWPLILFSHIPLSRPDDVPCGSLREKGRIRSGSGFGYQNTVGRQATAFLLRSLRPSLVFSGDDHDYCEIVHANPIEGEPSIREVSVKSLSMAMGIRRPGFQMLTLISRESLPILQNAPTSADRPCSLPDQLGIYLNIYVPLLVISLFMLAASSLCQGRPRRRRRNSPTPSQRHRIYPSTEDDDEPDAVYRLPSPALTNQRVASSPWVFNFMGKRRQLSLTRLGCVPAGSKRGFWPIFLLNVKGVATLPLTLFMAVSCLMWLT